MLWKSLPEAELKALAAETRPDEVKSLLRKYIGVKADDTEKQNEVIFDFHFFNLAFARDLGFTPNKVSTFISIMIDALDRDRSDGLRTMEGSFLDFKKALLAHSVERPPASAGIFDEADVTKIVDYVTNSYYRHFRLYKYVLAKKPRLVLTQREHSLVEVPPRKLRPLSAALQEG